MLDRFRSKWRTDVSCTPTTVLLNWKTASLAFLQKKSIEKNLWETIHRQDEKTSKDAERGESQTWDVKWRKMKYRNEITATLR